MFKKSISLKVLVFSLIVILAVVLRFWQLGSVPPALNWDEVSHGYNAYSILKTGADEWGVKFPLTSFRAFGDYKLPVYIYTLVPFVWILGLTEWSVRLPSALAGVGTVILTFFLVQKLFKNFWLATVAALLLAISPWHLFTSRAAFEANLALFLVIWAIYFFILGLEKEKFLNFSALFFGLSLFTYNSARIFVPLFLIILVIIFRAELQKLGGKLFLPAFLFLLFAILLLVTIFQPESQARFYWTTILDQGAINRINEARTTSQLPPILNLAINNRPVYFVTHFIPNYFSHFSPQFLFIKGGSNFQYSIPGRGVSYPAEAILIIFGLWQIFSKKTKFSVLILSWLLLVPLATAATRESPNVLRTILILPTWQIIASVGLLEIKRIFEKFNQKLSWVALILIFGILFFSAFNFWGEYLGNYRKNYSFAWQYGYKEVAQFAQVHKDEYDRMVITKKYGEPNEFLLFYQKIDPKFYQTDPNLVRCERSNWFWVDQFDGFEFVNDWEIGNLKKDQILPAACPQIAKTLAVKKMLLITSPQNFPAGGKLIKTINFLDGKPAFDLVEF